MKLVDLVFLNCFFYTPYGLYRQSKGMPMGDYSSRDSLDVDLYFSEFEIINSIENAFLKVHLYCRLVDNISAVVQRPFSEVVKLLELFAANYPPQMPLNCQLSFGYSRFLDLHIYNMYKVTSKEGLIHTRKTAVLVTHRQTQTFIRATNMHAFQHSCIESILDALFRKILITTLALCIPFSEIECKMPSRSERKYTSFSERRKILLPPNQSCPVERVLLSNMMLFLAATTSCDS